MSKKEIIYIDIEDDITAIIDKVKDTKAEIVAIVPPKRSAVLQSAVNMKLLKRSADRAKKKVVLISGEASLMPLAGAAGLFMADTLQSRPRIPEVEKPDFDESDIEEEVVVGKPAKATEETKPLAKTKKSKTEDIIPEDKEVKPKEKSEKLKALSVKGSSKIPNFSKFRLRMILVGGGLILLIVLWFVGFKVMPKANVVIKAQTSRIPVDSSFVADTSAQTNIAEKVLGANQQTLTKTVTQEFDATGEKDIGKKASGSMTVQNCDSSTELTVPAGTNFTDPSSGNSFISDEDVSVPGGVFGGGGCTTPGEAEVSVTAAESGDDKNLSARSYRAGGYGGTVTAYGEQMSGGTTKKVKVVSQADVDNATKKLNERKHEEEKQALQNQFTDNNYVLAETFAVTPGQVTSSPSVNTEASKGTLSAQFTYNMIAVQKDEMNQLLESIEKEQMGEGDQAILETGLDEATVKVVTKVSDTNLTFSIKTDGFAGPKLDENAIKDQIKNKRYSEAISTVKSLPGVNEVEVDLSPFWVSHVPGNSSKINISIEVSDHTLQ